MCYFRVFALFYFEFEGNQSTSPGFYLEGRSDLSEGFLRYEFGGAYIWRGLFLECYGMSLFNKAVLTKYDFSDRRGPFIFSTDWPSCRISSIEWPPRRSNQGFHIVNCCHLH